MITITIEYSWVAYLHNNMQINQTYKWSLVAGSLILVTKTLLSDNY